MKNFVPKIVRRKLKMYYGKTKHNYHIVTPSIWPFITSIACFSMAIALLTLLKNYACSSIFFYFSLSFLMVCALSWWRDIIRESTFEGGHSSAVVFGLKWAVLLFIISELMFFVGIFWSFFHSNINPVISIGATWPPQGITPFDFTKLPTLNTSILITSGVTITIAHHLLVENKKGSVLQTIFHLIGTIFLALDFTFCQIIEYFDIAFNFSDSIFGSTFFLSTGFHGSHVFLGTLALTVCAFRFILGHFTVDRHLNFEFAAWYWHFVDIVWLFLFIFIYWLNI